MVEHIARVIDTKMESDISSLKTNIANCVPYGGYITDLNTTRGQGVYMNLYTSTASNIPSTAYGCVLEMNFSTSNKIMVPMKCSCKLWCKIKFSISPHNISQSFSFQAKLR